MANSATETKPDHVKLFLPGPVEVVPEVLAEMARPMVGHRQEAYRELHRAVRSGLQWMFNTKNDFIVSTSSATGVWESCARNAVKKGCLQLTNGNFSERWEETTRLAGKPLGTYGLEWGLAHKPEEVKKHLETGKYDAIAIVHSETSAGVMDPLEELCEVAKQFPDVLIFVDAVSSAATTPIDVDRLGIDVMLVGVQKGFACPPGLAFYSLSKKALERSKTVADRGYYFNWEILTKHSGLDETPATPPIPQLRALAKQLERFKAEGLENRWKRHLALAERCRSWALDRGFGLHAEAPHYSIGLTCVANKRGIDVAGLAKWLLEDRYMAIDQGYGKIKHKTFRLAHMGDLQMSDLDGLLAAIDEFISRSGK
ncbi:MAG TPA: alanine--glyoxylate aminotransferase family protein [Planctomycetota bacterium]|nr:alanine--glyoxylate aminotransferase family protein [Planctomycetota bacterium]